MEDTSRNDLPKYTYEDAKELVVISKAQMEGLVENENIS